jgi:hypothetical protein
MISIEQGNLKIGELISSNTPFIAGKMGAVEQQVVKYFMANKSWDDSLRWHASNHAGVTPPTDFVLDYFIKEYVDALSNMDLLTIWFPDQTNSEEFIFSEHFCKNAEFIAGLQALEPFYHQNPWSKYLEGKKVLVVHPFESSIKEQFSKKELLFEDKNVLPDFELITFKTYQTHGGGNTDLPWNVCYEDMINRINSLDFHVALVGCGAYGLPVCNQIKKMGKPVVHVGGGLQIMFGIKGNRWDNTPAVNKYYNQNWKRPYDYEKTRNHAVVEGSTYW